ncbi:MAG: hypothetical protein AAFR29_08840 [Pseudomonadota bacterium]
MHSLSRGGVRAIIDDQCGASIRSAVFGTAPLLRGAANGVTDPLAMGCFPCAPYFGRVFEPISRHGVVHRLNPTHTGASPDTALHGEGWQKRWTVIAKDADTLHLETRSGGHAPGEFPFAWTARQTVTLLNDGLTVSLTVTNDDDTPAPMGAGLHPYLPYHRDMTITLPHTRWIAPPGLALAPLADGLFKTPTQVPDDVLDHSFVCIPDRPTPVTLSAPGICLTLETPAPFVHFYHPPDAPFICVEPISHLPGAVDEASPQTLITPGECATVSFTLRMTQDAHSALSPA